MKLAVLGEHPQLESLAPCFRPDSRHQVTTLAEVSDGSAAEWFPGAERVERGELLLERGDFDAVILASQRDRTLQSARQLATQGVPLIVLPLAGQGSAFLYELSLIRDDNHVPLFALFPWRRHPLVRQLRDLIEDGRLGEIRQLEWNRSEVTTDATSRVPLAHCDQRLLADVDLIRQLVGNYNQITAIRSGAGEGSVVAQSVTLSGRGLPESIWTIRAARDNCWSLVIRAANGEVTLTSDSTGEPNALLSETQQSPVSNDEVQESILQELDDFEAGLRSNIARNDWQEFIQVTETVEATHQSVRRRRTIDLYFELTSERGQFKSQMTALGCGVLMLTLLLVIVVLLVGQVFDLGPTTMKYARLFAFAPLFLFLLAQILILIARPSIDQS